MLQNYAVFLVVALKRQFSGLELYYLEFVDQLDLQVFESLFLSMQLFQVASVFGHGLRVEALERSLLLL